MVSAKHKNRVYQWWILIRILDSVQKEKNRHDNATGQIHSSLQIQGLLVSMSVMLGTNSATKIYAFSILTGLHSGAADLYQVNPIIKHFPQRLSATENFGFMRNHGTDLSYPLSL